jgi:hypothetical protein
MQYSKWDTATPEKIFSGCGKVMYSTPWALHPASSATVPSKQKFSLSVSMGGQGMHPLPKPADAHGEIEQCQHNSQRIGITNRGNINAGHYFIYLNFININIKNMQIIMFQGNQQDENYHWSP